MAIPLVQTGALTLPSGVYTMCISRNDIQQQIPNYNVSGACGGSTSTHPAFVQGLKVQDYTGVGFVKKDAESTYGLSQSSTITMPSNMDVKAQSWRIRRNWQLFDVTGSGDSSKGYTYGMPNTSMSISGVANAGFADDHGSESLSITTFLSQFGTLAGTLNLSSKQEQSPFPSGGPPMVSMSGQFTGSPTFTPLTSPGTNDDFEWLLGTSVVAPVEGTLTVDIGGSESNLTPNVVVYDVTTELVPRDGGSIRVTARMRVTL